MIFSFHPDAEVEFNMAIDYYENCESGLGCDFSIEVRDTIRNIVSHPTVWPVIDTSTRRCLVNRFPYGVIYSIEQNMIFVLAVMHMRRSPDYWKKRR